MADLYPGENVYPSENLFPGVVGDLPPGLYLTATPEPDYSPPRVRIDISDTRSVPATELTISRLDANGRTRLVRTADAGPLPISGGVATIYDYEVPFGTRVSYSVDDDAAPVVTMLDVVDIWLIHIGAPSKSVRADLRAASNASEDWNVEQGVFTVLEREDPIVVTGGARTSAASALVAGVSSDAELKAMRLLLADASPLLMNVSPALNCGLSTSYIAVGNVRPTRLPGDAGTSGRRHIDMPYQVIGRPAGGTQASLTWNDVAVRGADDYTAAAGSQYLTWQAIIDAGVGSWAELAAPST